MVSLIIKPPAVRPTEQLHLNWKNWAKQEIQGHAGALTESQCVMFEKGLKRAETRRCGRTYSSKAKYEMSSHNDKSTSLPAVC